MNMARSYFKVVWDSLQYLQWRKGYQILIQPRYLNVSQQLFLWTRVLKHSKYVKMKQFSKVDIKQNNVSSFILLIKCLVYQWDPRHLQGIALFTLIFCLHKEVRVLSKISNKEKVLSTITAQNIRRLQQ